MFDAAESFVRHQLAMDDKCGHFFNYDSSSSEKIEVREWYRLLPFSSVTSAHQILY